MLIASGMLAYGTHEIEEYFVKSNKIAESSISRPWNILEPKKELLNDDIKFMYSYNDKKMSYIHILHDKGSMGVFFKGFLGYNSNPNYIELVVWLFSLIFGLSLWKKAYS